MPEHLVSDPREVRREDGESSTTKHSDLTRGYARFHQRVGEVMWTFMHCQTKRDLPLREVERRYLAPITLGQVITLSGRGFESPQIMPGAVLFVAYLNPKDERRHVLSEGLLDLPWSAWHGGTRAWLIDYCAPFGLSHLIATPELDSLLDSGLHYFDGGHHRLGSDWREFLDSRRGH